MLEDTQLTEPKNKIAIERVGITNFKMPIFVIDKIQGIQHTVATIDVFVDLEANFKGINMSRLPIALQKFHKEQLSLNIISDIAEHIKNISEAKRCDITYSFLYFIQKIAPVSKEMGICYYDIKFNVIKTEYETLFNMNIIVCGTSLCPCSKNISDGSAHNQRSFVDIKLNIKPKSFIWIEDIITIIESNLSCQIYSVLKRIDEKYVTEEAYDNPVFVEDIVRGIYTNINNDITIKNNINYFIISVSNEESIHQHNATAIIDSRLI